MSLPVMDLPVTYAPWDDINFSPTWPDSIQPSTEEEHTFAADWLSSPATPQLCPDLAGPMSPSEAHDDAAHTPVTPFGNMDRPFVFSHLLQLDYGSDLGLMPSFPAYPQSAVGPKDHHHHHNHNYLSYGCLPAALTIPSTPSSLVFSDHEAFGPSPVEPASPPPLPTLEENTPKRKKSASHEFCCDYDGCTTKFTTSRRDLQRHKASVHGPSIQLVCGELLSFRPDNIARHRKKCKSCMAAHVKKMEEEGTDSKPRPGRKRKMAAAA